MGYAVLAAVRLSWFCVLQYGMTQKYSSVYTFYLEDGHNKFLRNVGKHIGEYTILYLRGDFRSHRLRAYHVLRLSHAVAQLNVAYAVLSDTRHWTLPSAEADLAESGLFVLSVPLNTTTYSLLISWVAA
jgi:hypothetical protein